MENTTEYEDVHENRKYKDTLFRIVFREKKDLLNLYNAINGTTYTDSDELEINTLENVVYMSYKNDISFLISNTLNLYEHQSTRNENMPLRGLLYLAKLIDKYITENCLNIYQKKRLKIPTPQYIVFYNGTEDEPDERIMRLSDSFPLKGGCLECEAKLLNINYGHNRELLEKCRRLEEYAIFVARVRMYMEDEKYSQKQAVCQAIEECIQEDILRDVLIRNKSEVIGMVLTTFNKELYEKNLKEDAYADGIKAERIEEKKRLLEKISIKLAKGKSVEEIADALEEDIQTIRKLIQELENN